jgi:hypothetical protein
VPTARTRGIAVLVAAVGLALPAAASAAYTSVSIGPATGGSWELTGEQACVADPNILWGTTFYVTSDRGNAMPLQGETRNAVGDLVGLVPVTVFLSGFRKGESANPARFATTSDISGHWKLSIPQRNLTRDRYAWAQVPDAQKADSGLICFNYGWALDVGQSLPLVMNVRPAITMDKRPRTTHGRTIKLGATLVADDPTHAGSVLLQRHVGSKWKQVGTALRPTTRGRLAFNLKFLIRGTHEYRLLFTPASKKGDYINTAERRFKIKFVPPAPRRAKPAAVTYTAGPTVTTTSTAAQIACTGLNCRPSH